MRVLLLVLLIWSVLLNCRGENKKEDFQHLEKYFQNLPKEEKDNESLYNKENLLLIIESNYFQQSYYQVLEILEKSYGIFTESDGGDEFDYYFGSIIERLIRTDKSNFIQFLVKKTSQEKKLYKSKIIISLKKVTNTGISSNIKQITFLTNYELLYNHYHLKNVCSAKYDYYLEKKALAQIYPYWLTPLADISNIISAKNNISKSGKHLSMDHSLSRCCFFKTTCFRSAIS